MADNGSPGGSSLDGSRVRIGAQSRRAVSAHGKGTDRADRGIVMAGASKSNGFESGTILLQ